MLLGVLPNTYALLGERIDFTYPKLAIVYFASILILLNFAFRVFKEKNITIKLNKVDILVLLFLLANVVSTYFSINFYTSVFSEFYGPVKTGLLFTASLITIYFYFRHNFKSLNLRFAFWITLISILFDLFWGFQTRSAESFYHGIPIRMASIEFNVIFFANYLLVLPTVSLALCLYEKRAFFKIIALLSFFIAIFAIITSLTRSVWIVSAISLFIFVHYYYRGSISRVSKKTKRFVILRSLLAIIALVYIFYPIVYPRVIAVTHDPLQTNSVIIRLDEQKAAIEIAKNNFLFGSGPNTIRYVYQQHRNPTLNLNPVEWENFTTYIRSYYLEIAATTGIFGLIFFLEIIINILKKSKYIFISKNFLLVGLLLAWLSIVLHFLFYGPTPLSLVLFWSFSGILLGFSGNTKPLFIKTFSLLSRPLSITLLILCSLSFVLLTRDIKSKLIFHSVPANNANIQTLNQILEADKLNPYDPNYKLEYAYRQLRTVHFEINSQTPRVDKIKDRLQKAKDSLDYVNKLDPGNAKIARYISEDSYFLFRVAKYEKQDRSQEFRIALNDALAAQSQAPTMPDYLDLVTQVYLENDAKNLKEAESQARKTISIAPTYSQAWHHLGEALKQQGRFDEAIQSYEETLKYDPENPVSKAEIEKIKILKQKIS